MGEVHLDWSGATVDDTKLTVPLDGELAEGWRQHFETTVKLLGRGQWGKVEIEEQAVRVDGIEAGDEDDVRFYLEGVVEQANSAESADQERERPENDHDEDDEDEEDEEDEEDASEAEPEGPDAELTERFRSFAEERKPDSGSGSDSESQSQSDSDSDSDSE